MRSRFRSWVVSGIIAVVTCGALVVLAVHWVDRQTPDARPDDVLNAAKSTTTRMLSYTPDSVDQDVAEAATMLTGEFEQYYRNFTDTVVAPSAKEKGISATATVSAAGITKLSDSRAEVLVFVDQEIESEGAPDPTRSASSVRVVLVLEGHQWKIAEFAAV